MKHHIAWHQESRIAITAYDGDLSLEELQVANRLLTEFVTVGQKPVHLIVDTRKMGKFPFDMAVLKETLASLQDEGWGWAILLGDNRLVRFFAEVVGKQFGLSVKTAASIEEAEAMLQRLDSSL